MLKENVVRQVQELHRQPMSQRAIARKLGIDRATVGRIAQGKHPTLQETRRTRRKQHPPQPCPPHRCPHCGQRVVYQPCVYCKTRNAIQHGIPGVLDRSHKLEVEPLGLNLVTEQQRRHAKVRARKLRRIRQNRRSDEVDEANRESIGD